MWLLGVVQSVKVYGAFLDIGGAMGLLHISQITHERLTTVEAGVAVQYRPTSSQRAQAGASTDQHLCGGRGGICLQATSF